MLQKDKRALTKTRRIKMHKKNEINTHESFLQWIHQKRWMSLEYIERKCFIRFTVATVVVVAVVFIVLGWFCLHKIHKLQYQYTTYSATDNDGHCTHTSRSIYTWSDLPFYLFLPLLLILLVLFSLFLSIWLFCTHFMPSVFRCFCICKTFQTFRSHLIIPCCFWAMFFMTF